MSLYLDASVLVALFVIDPSSARAAGFLAAHLDTVIVSDFAAAEFSSAIARRVRMHDLIPDEGQTAFLHFDAWVGRTAQREEITVADIGTADHILRRFAVNLRTPDAIHVAAVMRLNATLVTFDCGKATAARELDTAIATP